MQTRYLSRDRLTKKARVSVRGPTAILVTPADERLARPSRAHVPALRALVQRTLTRAPETLAQS
jgi:hypothetical protein